MAGCAVAGWDAAGWDALAGCPFCGRRLLAPPRPAAPGRHGWRPAPAGAVLPSEGLASPGCPAARDRGWPFPAAGPLARRRCAPWGRLGSSARSSVWLPCHECAAANGIKKPLAPGRRSRGARRSRLVSLLRASQVRGCSSASRVPPSPTTRLHVKLSPSPSHYPRHRVRKFSLRGGDARLRRAVDVRRGGRPGGLGRSLRSGGAGRGADQRLDARGGHRPGDQEALAVPAAHLPQLG